MIWIGLALIFLGTAFSGISAVGAIRFPDFYSRAHAIGVLDTLGTLLILTGLIFTHGFTLLSAKLFILLIFIYIANPTVTHVFFRAAIRSGLKPWSGKAGKVKS